MVACGAKALICESTEARNVKDEVIRLLNEAGHTTVDCTVNNGTSQGDIINKQVAKSNAQKLDLTVSIHFNAGANDKSGNGRSTGVEVLMTKIDGIKKEVGTRICNNVAKLGFKNRGNKVRTNLGFLNKTKAPAVLVECCFVDDADDVKLYSAKTMAKAIAEGIHGSEIKEASNKTSYVVRVITDTLNIREGVGTSHKVVGTLKKGDAYTIVEEKDGWGLLKIGEKQRNKWISLSSKYVQKI
jgi:N-acetylmuramoyl-L-alanine amidase